MAEKLVVIGGTAAGLSAASKAKRLKRDLEVTVFEKSGYISYGACGLPYYVGGMIGKADDLVSLTVDDMKQTRGIPVYIHHEVTVIDRKRKSVTVRNLDTGEEKQWPYDKLVIATGAIPVKPAIPGIESKGVYYLRNVEDGIKLKTSEKKGNRIAIIGGGFIGLETAEQLSEAGLKVTVCEAMERLLPFLPEQFSMQVADQLTAHGVELRIGAKVQAIKSEGNAVKGLVLADGELDCDDVLVSIGVRPASQLAAACGLPLGVKGAIAVDDTMRTSDPSIWACGDCAQMKNQLTGKPCYIPLGTTANKMGKVAGTNIGGVRETFPGVLGSMVTKVFDLSIAATGLSLANALKEGYAAKECAITKNDRASYYPGAKPNQINLVVDTRSGRLLGAQAIGSMTVAGRINTLCACITAGMTVKQVSELDLVYAPPFAPVYDPILIAASQAEKLVEG